MTSKERAFLKKMAGNLDCVLSLGKSTLTPEFTQAVNEAVTARELIKINVLKNCDADIHQVAEMLANRTKSTVVQIIGRKIVLFKKAKENSKYEFNSKHEKN